MLTIATFLVDKRNIATHNVDRSNINRKDWRMFLFIAFLLILGLALWVREVSNRVHELEGISRREVQRSSDLEAQVFLLKRGGDRPDSPPKSTPAKATPPPLPPEPKPEPVRVQWIPAAPILPKPQIPPIEVPPAPEAPNLADNLATLAEKTGGWEALIGGNILNKLGALILVIGIALFLSYSFAHMGPLGRSLTGAAIGAALLVGGIACERLERYRLFSRGVMAAGWATLYFTSFAMHAFPAARVIMDPVLGTSLMVVVATGMVLHSLRYRVQSLTALAYGCVFAALALSDLTSAVAVALMPLAVSALFLARKFEWNGLALFGAAATYATFLSRPSSNATLFAIESMLVIFWALFEVFDLLRAAARKEPGTLDYAFFSLNALAGLGASAAVWYRMAPDSMWEFCTASGALYLLSTLIRLALGRDAFYPLTLTLSAVLGALAIFAHFQGLWIALGMLVEAEVLFLAGLYFNIRFARVLSMTAFLACAMSLFDLTGAEVVLGASIHQWAPPLALLASVFYLNRFLAKNAAYFGYFASAFIAVLLGFELPWRFVGVAWLAAGLLLFELGLRQNLKDLRIQAYGLGLLGTASATLAYLDPLHVRTVWTYAVGAIVALSYAIRATKFLRELPELERGGIRIVGAFGAAALGGVLATRLAPEAYWGISMLGTSIVLIELALRALPEELWLAAIGLNFAALLRLVVEHAQDIQKHPSVETLTSCVVASLLPFALAARLIREESVGRVGFRIASGAFGSVFALVTLWMMLPDAFVPAAFASLGLMIVGIGILANKKDVVIHGQAVTLIATAALYVSPLNAGAERIWNTVAVATAHLALCAGLRRKEAVSGVVHAGAAALVVFFTVCLEVSGGLLTVSWGIEAIMLLALGFAIRERAIRLSGLALLLLCIAKLFFYDLRNLETPYRILSFIGLGAMLLGVSWTYTRFKDQIEKYL
jgi:uncharacterized membrane protein